MHVAVAFNDPEFRTRPDYGVLLERLNSYLYHAACDLDVFAGPDADAWLGLWWQVVRGELGDTNDGMWTAFDAYVSSDLMEAVGPLGEVGFHVVKMFAHVNAPVYQAVAAFETMVVPAQVRERVALLVASDAFLDNVQAKLDNATGAVLLALAWLEPPAAAKVLAAVPLVSSARDLLGMQPFVAPANVELFAGLLYEMVRYAVDGRARPDPMTAFEFELFATLTGATQLAPTLCYPHELVRYAHSLTPASLAELASCPTGGDHHPLLWRAPWPEASPMLDLLVASSPGLACAAATGAGVDAALARHVDAYVQRALPATLAREAYARLAERFPGTVAELVDVTRACL